MIALVAGTFCCAEVHHLDFGGGSSDRNPPIASIPMRLLTTSTQLSFEAFVRRKMIRIICYDEPARRMEDG